MKALFALVVSSDNDNNSHVCSALELERLARDVGEPISKQQAVAMVTHLASLSSSSSSTKTNTDEAVLTFEDFQRLWSHPESEIGR